MPVLRYRYQTLEMGGHDIHFRTLRDVQQYDETQHRVEATGISSANWGLFGVLWPSGEELARQMLIFDVAGKRVLELGCGVGLASLVLNARQSDISATDYHPDAEAYLQLNTGLNNGRPIPFERTSWLDDDSSLGKFDLIIGSDLLYESGHAEVLSQFIDRHALPACEVIIVDPGRGNHARFSKKMAELGYDNHRLPPGEVVGDAAAYKGVILAYDRAEIT
jgi:predicted nicotinamide N-methyase